MNFEQNLFISYAHIDDRPLTLGERGQVTGFHATLKAILSMRMGHEAKIWRGDKLQGNDVFSSEIVARFTQSTALVSIVTSRYLNSEWCTREAREFVRAEYPKLRRAHVRRPPYWVGSAQLSPRLTPRWQLLKTREGERRATVVPGRALEGRDELWDAAFDPNNNEHVVTASADKTAQL
jgi:hypothetical protein